MASSGIRAAVLAGGAGSRLGGDKSGALLAGRKMIEYPIAALRQAGLDPFVVTKADRPVDLPGIETVTEPAQPRHPLLGIVTALEAANGGPVLVVACDLPLLPAAFFSWLAAHSGDTVVPDAAGQLQPLAARYGPGSLPVLEAGLSASRPVKPTVEELDPVIVGGAALARFGDPERIFHNINDPADLSRAEALLAAD